MPNFNFIARTASGQVQKGTLSAHSKEAAIEALRGKQLQPVVVKSAQSKGLNISIPFPGGGRVKSKDLVIFTRQFAVMISAGVPILRSLNILKEQSRSTVFKKILDKVIADVQGGSNLSDALSNHPRVFSSIYVNMVRAGEAGGSLEAVLERLATQQEKDAAIKGKIKGAMIYPAVIFSVTLIAFYVLMTFIVPKIGSILVNLSGGTQSLPIYTRILLSISKTLKQPSVIIGVIVGLPLLIVLFRHYIRTKRGKYQWDSVLLKIPIVKTIITKTAIARFSRIFASLTGSGVAILEAIDTTAGAIGNSVIEKELLNSSKAIQSGSQLSKELAKSKHFPPIVAQMLAVGEETGKTDTVILKIAEFYEEEVDATVGALSSIIEPVMIIFLGSMVGLIVVSVFGPITKVETSVGK